MQCGFGSDIIIEEIAEMFQPELKEIKDLEEYASKIEECQEEARYEVLFFGIDIWWYFCEKHGKPLVENPEKFGVAEIHDLKEWKVYKKFPYYVVVPWHYGPDEIKNEEEEKKFIEKLKEEIEEIKKDPEEAFHLLKGEAYFSTDEIIDHIMNERFASYESAEGKWELAQL